MFDSYYLSKQKQLRMSFLGRWNGIFYFVPTVLVASSRLPVFEQTQAIFNLIIVYFNYALAVSTLASIVDRAIAPLLQKDKWTGHHELNENQKNPLPINDAYDDF